MDDGLLDVIIFKNFNKLEYMRHAISIVQGRRPYQPKVIHRRIKSIRINTDHPMEIQADGLPHGHTPATVTILHGALRVRVPVGAQLASAHANGQYSTERNPAQPTQLTTEATSIQKGSVNVR